MRSLRSSVSTRERRRWVRTGDLPAVRLGSGPGARLRVDPATSRASSSRSAGDGRQETSVATRTEEVAREAARVCSAVWPKPWWRGRARPARPPAALVPRLARLLATYDHGSSDDDDAEMPGGEPGVPVSRVHPATSREDAACTAGPSWAASANSGRTGRSSRSGRCCRRPSRSRARYDGELVDVGLDTRWGVGHAIALAHRSGSRRSKGVGMLRAWPVRPGSPHGAHVLAVPHRRRPGAAPPTGDGRQSRRRNGHRRCT